MADSITGITSDPILWTQPAKAENLADHISIAYRIGFPGTVEESRRPVERTGMILEYTFQFNSPQELKEFISFFEDRKSSLQKFWLPVWMNSFELYEPVLENSDIIKIRPCSFSLTYLGHERIWMLLKDGSRIVRRVTSASDEGSYEEIRIDTPMDRTVTPEDLRVFGKFILCRFASDELTVEYPLPNTSISVVKVRFVELLGEYEGEEGTIHPFEELYDLEWAGKLYLYTSYCKDIEWQQRYYQALPVKRGRLERNLNLFADQALEVTIRPTDELRRYLASLTLQKLSLILRRLDLVSGECKVIFKGVAKGLSLNRDYLTVSFAPLGSVFSYRIPRFVFQPLCNNTLFDSHCGLSRDSWRVWATLSEVSEDGCILKSPDFATKPDGWFVGGYVRWNFQYRLITEHSSDTVRIQSAFEGLQAGQKVEAFPGCDGSPATCKNKFNNLNNFSGFPYIPTSNPVIWGVR